MLVDGFFLRFYQLGTRLSIAGIGLGLGPRLREYQIIPYAFYSAENEGFVANLLQAFHPLW